MKQENSMKQAVLDKIEVMIPPRITMQIAAIAAERGRTINDVILEAINEYIEKSKQ
ncbi:MAG: hypothetical protein H0Z40_05045 [Desulfotomaculum sp.]|nr:hypothetical protein [Desulfotomaculum sp.]